MNPNFFTAWSQCFSHMVHLDVRIYNALINLTTGLLKFFRFVHGGHASSESSTQHATPVNDA